MGSYSIGQTSWFDPVFKTMWYISYGGWKFGISQYVYHIIRIYRSISIILLIQTNTLFEKWWHDKTLLFSKKRLHEKVRFFKTLRVFVIFSKIMVLQKKYYFIIFKAYHKIWFIIHNSNIRFSIWYIIWLPYIFMICVVIFVKY